MPARRPSLHRSTSFRRAAQRLSASITALRVKCGLTRGELASRTGIGVAALRRMECGGGNPTLAVLNGLAQALGVTVDKLLGG
jgi:XRE family aerobic/anaerobic benzoate catabolism transcriptional regulator